MRVSWIDETHLQALLGRLEAPMPVEAEMEAPELETLPEEGEAGSVTHGGGVSRLATDHRAGRSTP
jgi:hypothetical protein